MNHQLFHRDFTLIVIGQIISLFGNAILSFALPLYLLKLTGSGSIFGLVMAISIIPMIFLSPVGGILADRVNRRNIMVCLDFITCAIVLVSGFFITSIAIPCVAITLIFLSIIRSFYQPAVQSSIPAITCEENLLKGNSIVNMVNAVASLLGPILGGVLYGFVGIIPIVFISSLAFFISALMELFIKMPFTKKPLTEGIFKTIRSDFSESIHFITKKQPIILKTMLLSAALNLLLTSFIMVGIPYIVNITLSLSSELYGFAQSAIGIGSLIGGLLVGIFSKRLNFSTYHRPLLVACLSLLPIGIVLMLNTSAMLSFGVIFFSSLFMMMCATMFSIIIITFIQQLTPLELTGKVMALVTTSALCATPIGQSIYGYLLELLPKQIYLIIFIALALLLVITFVAKKMWQQEAKRVELSK